MFAKITLLGFDWHDESIFDNGFDFAEIFELKV